MKKLLLVSALSCASGLSYGLCSYPLNASAAQYAQAGLTSFPYINSQSVSAGVTTSDTALYALSAGGVNAAINSATAGSAGGDITLPSSGIIAFEFALDYFPSAYGNMLFSTGFITSNGAFATALQSDSFVFDLAFVDSSLGAAYTGVLPVAYSRSNNVSAPADIPLIPVALPFGSNYRVGLYLNMSTRQAGYTVNGINYGYIGNDLNGNPFRIPAGVSSVMLGVTGQGHASSTDAIIGSTIGGTLITDSAQFTQPFPAGTKDICGVTLLADKHKHTTGNGHSSHGNGKGNGHTEK